MAEPPFLAVPVLLLPRRRLRRSSRGGQRLRLPGLAPPPRPQTCRASSRQVGGDGKGRGGTCRDGKISDLGCYCRGSIAIEPGEKHNRKGRCWIEGEFSLLKCELHVGRKVEM